MQPLEIFHPDDDHNHDESQVSLVHGSHFSTFFRWRNPKFRLCSYLLFIFMLILIIIFSLLETLKLKAITSQEPLLLSKPFNDKRSFYSYKLENGLQTLLITDPECVNPGSAVSINAGSKQEGVVQGLAHLLEHVLFMGSKNYPIEDHFFTLVSMLSGTSNAYTTNDATVYYWTIKQSQDNDKQFDEMMDIWRDFFQNPLITEDKVNREMYAVNSEYVSYLNRPAFQLDFLMKMMMNPKSPNAAFGYGNLGSFRIDGVNVTEELMGFYEKYYVGDQMNLVLLGNYTVQQLVSKAEKMFSSLRRSSSKREVLPNNPDSEGFWQGKLVKFKQIQGKVLILAWILPELLTKYKKNPLEYWSDMFNSEHKNGLVWKLKSLGLIQSFSAKAYSYEIDLTVYTINFKLTNMGFENLDTIVKYFLAYVKKIDDGINKERWSKLKRVRELAYDYGNRGDETNEMANMAYSLSLVPKDEVVDILRFIGNVLKEFSSEEIHMINLYLTLERSLIILGNNDYNNSTEKTREKTNDLSYFTDLYLGNYSDLYEMVWDSSELSQSEFQNLQDSSNKEQYEELILPPDNQYIPNNLLMPCKNPASCEDSEVNNDIKTLPILISNSENHKVWYKIQRNFNKLDPKASLHLQIISPLTYNSSKAVFLNTLSRKWLKWHLKPMVRQLQDLGYNVRIQSTPNLELQIYGFSNKMDLIARDFGQIIKNCSEFEYIQQNQLVFNLIKNTTIQKIKKKMFGTPLEQTKQHMVFLLNLNSRSYNYSEMLQAPELPKDEFIQFMQNYTQTNFINVLIFGAISQNQASEVFNKLTSNGLNSRTPDDLPHYQTLKLPKGKKRFVALNYNPDDINTGFISYFQFGDNELEMIAKFLIFYDFFYSKAFDFLRTKAQLGYYVGVKPSLINGIMGFVIYVQGETKNVSIFEEKVEEFLDYFLGTLEEITEKDFLMMREAKINDILMTSKLEDLEHQFWEIIEGNLLDHWDIKEKMASTMKNIDIVRCKSFWKSFLIDRNEFGRLNVAVVPDSLKGNYDGEVYEYEEFKSGMEYYEEIKHKLNIFILY